MQGFKQLFFSLPLGDTGGIVAEPKIYVGGARLKDKIGNKKLI